MEPNDYPHRVLIVASGMSPQVLTETVHALAISRKPAFVPTEIHLVSTRTGASHARLTLLEGDAHFLRLCQDYGLDRTMFDASRIHAIVDPSGGAIDDIRTPADNEAAADFITGFICEQTRRQDAAVHVSMAGGRKTMGYYAGYALSLYGRAQDRLSHVLVSEGFEGHRDFYYPTPASRPIYRDGKPALDASEARVELAEIPFVRLREELPEKAISHSALYSGRHGFREAVASANRARQPALMRLDLHELEFHIGEQSLAPLGAANLGFLCWLAWRRASGIDDTGIGGIERHGQAIGQQLARFLTHLDERDQAITAKARSQGQPALARFPELGKSIDALAQRGLASADDFSYRRTNLNKAMIRLLGTPLAKRFELVNFGVKFHPCYGFADFDERFELVFPRDGEFAVGA